MKAKSKIIYVAHCIENGERFTSDFQSVETDKKKLMEFGCNLAIEWGGECVRVVPWKAKQTKMVRLVDLKDKSKKPMETTQRIFDN